MLDYYNVGNRSKSFRVLVEYLEDYKVFFVSSESKKGSFIDEFFIIER